MYSIWFESKIPYFGLEMNALRYLEKKTKFIGTDFIVTSVSFLINNNNENFGFEIIINDVKWFHFKVFSYFSYSQLYLYPIWVYTLWSSWVWGNSWKMGNIISFWFLYCLFALLSILWYVRYVLIQSNFNWNVNKKFLIQKWKFIDWL